MTNSKEENFMTLQTFVWISSTNSASGHSIFISTQISLSILRHLAKSYLSQQNHTKDIERIIHAAQQRTLCPNFVKATFLYHVYSCQHVKRDLSILSLLSIEISPSHESSKTVMRELPHWNATAKLYQWDLASPSLLTQIELVAHKICISTTIEEKRVEEQ